MGVSKINMPVRRRMPGISIDRAVASNDIGPGRLLIREHPALMLDWTEASEKAYAAAM